MENVNRSGRHDKNAHGIIVVRNQPIGAAVRDFGESRVEQVNEKALLVFIERVVVHGDIERFGGFPRLEGQRAGGHDEIRPGESGGCGGVIRIRALKSR